MDINFNKYQILDKFSVSRETFYLLEHYKELVLKKNEQINLISRKNADNFVERHILDSAQAIDFIDKKGKYCTDIGSGAGLPGLVLAIVLKGKNISMKMNLYEKSHHKSKFLEQIAKKDVPTGKKYKFVDRSFLPSDRDFRNAWEISESELTDGVGD